MENPALAGGASGSKRRVRDAAAIAPAALWQEPTRRKPFPLFVNEFIRDVSHLSTQQIGAYALLLLRRWDTGNLPSDEKHLARLAKTSASTWRRISPEVMALLLAPPDRLPAHCQSVVDRIENARMARAWRDKQKAEAARSAIPANSHTHTRARVLHPVHPE